MTVKYLSNCPDEKPFYIAGECKDCGGEQNIFDIEQKICTKCEINT